MTKEQNKHKLSIRHPSIVRLDSNLPQPLGTDHDTWFCSTSTQKNP